MSTGHTRFTASPSPDAAVASDVSHRMVLESIDGRPCVVVYVEGMGKLKAEHLSIQVMPGALRLFHSAPASKRRVLLEYANPFSFAIHRMSGALPWVKI